MRSWHSFFLLLTVLFCVSCTGGRPHKPLIGGIKRSMADREEVWNQDSEEDSLAPTDGGIEVPAPLNDRPEQLLRRTGYTASYNRNLRIVNWVAWHLTADHTSGPHKRKGIAYTEDTEVPAPRATTFDYQQSGYDRGHMCPSGDNKWSREAQQDCFLLSNMCPQDHNLNGGDWNELEMACRRWAEEYGDLYIVCGPVLYRQRHKTIGRNKITVPEAFFKVILCLQGEPKAIGFIYKNNSGNRPMDSYVNSIDEVERITGIDFFPSLPDDMEEKVEKEENISKWN